jgi:hypothetical protein
MGELVPQPKTSIFQDRGSKPERFYHGNLEVPLEYEPWQRLTRTRTGRTGIFARVSLRESTIPEAGYGVHLREDVAADRIILLYWGDKMSMQEAHRRKTEVICILELISLHCCCEFSFSSG